MTPASTTCDISKSLRHITDSPDTSTSDLANTINQAFLSSMNSFLPLPPDFSVNPITCSNCTNPAPELVVSTHSVFKKLSTLNSSKAQGPDGIPAWLLKENADLFAEPVRDILNYSYGEGNLPQSWKEADIPVPNRNQLKILTSIYDQFRSHTLYLRSQKSLLWRVVWSQLYSRELIAINLGQFQTHPPRTL